jgi:exonuclease SbcC
MRADGFGPLRGEFTFSPDRLTLVVDENERGKSSLLAAVHAALYGLDDDRRGHRLMTARERWRPWSGGTYRLELELECAGERYVVVRDFERDQTEVWTSGGREVTNDFREGKAEFPIGKKLLGLDAGEFEKCAFVRQGELEQVIPMDERGRRDSTLRARLEHAADARLGDTNAIEAIEALTRAAASYTDGELGRTIMVENAIRELELWRATLETELGAIDHDLAELAEPMQELARLADEEAAVRDGMSRLERAWRARRVEEARVRLELDRENRDDLARLSAEADTLARLDPGDPVVAGDADALASRAGELARLEREIDRVSVELDAACAAVAARGFDPARVEELARRFASLPYDQQALLRDESRHALEIKSEAADAEAGRREGEATLHEIDQLRTRRRVPGWIALAVSLAAVIAAGVGGTLDERWPWLALLAGGGAMAVIAVTLLIVGSKAAADEHEAADQAIEEAEQQLHALRVRQIGLDGRLDALAEALGFADVDALRGEWSDHQRVAEESGPLRQAEHRLAALRRQRDEAIAESRALLDRLGGGTPDPEGLERAVLALRQRLAARERHARLVSDVIPTLEKSRLDERTRRDLEHHLASAAAEPATESRDDAPELGSLAEVEAEIAAARRRADELATRRGDRRARFEERSRERLEARAEREARLARIERALARAARFRLAVDLARETIEGLARETHRRWAEFLNERVSELLSGLGTGIEKVRFGEDLDFSVRLPHGATTTRGRAQLQLSCGARDQLHLAVRIAVSEYLSRGREPIPLLIDDAFATSDDERARAGMRLLIERLAPRHQVVVVTCHRRRHETFAAQDPELYASHVAWVEPRIEEART